MHWTTPSFVEIDMSAEIGGYQGDDEDSREEPPFAHPEAIEAAATTL